MLRLSNLTLPPEGDVAGLRDKAARVLGVDPREFTHFRLSRQSIDARKKGNVHYVCAVELSHPRESELVKRAAGAVLFTPKPYTLPPVTRKENYLRPVVVGMGPAGLFAALFLARAGLAPLILERGYDVDRRTAAVASFWQGEPLDTASNVQFGEGGAGTFSDGKLTSGIHDPRISAVHEVLVAHGAPEDITYSHKPHIGTDVLRTVVKSIRAELVTLGCEVRFGHRLDGLTVKNGALAAVTVAEVTGGRYEAPCDTLILAPGHSARDTFRMLKESGVALAPKAFAMGVRIEHLQRDISAGQYGDAWTRLPPSDYKLACHLPDGRSAFTFCVCPGGQVVAAASEEGGVVTNGMSCRARSGPNCNGGFLVGVSPADFGCLTERDDPLAGLAFQRHWEELAFQMGGGNYAAPCQRVGAFLGSDTALGGPEATYRPGVIEGDLRRCLPGFVSDTLAAALPIFDRKLHGFAASNALLTGVETRSSSPVRIPRREDLQSTSLGGLYPCGEGAGYAGGILSAAVDGIRVAEAVATAGGVV